MTAIWLIAVNFVRQQRLVTYIFLAWVVGFGVVFGLSGEADAGDILALFHQQAAYGVVYTLFLAASSVHGERKSRRILAVLSKGIHRYEYIAGLMLGSVLMTMLYMTSLGLVNMWLGTRIGILVAVWSTILATTMAALVVSAVATMFSTFSHPLLATMGTLAVVGLPAGLRMLFGKQFLLASPAAYVMENIFRSNFQTGWSGGWTFAGIALLQAVAFWVIAGVIFQRKDVTAAIE